ncbi:uncharacterized protein LOC143055189 [Mytilus galloprovincialis]|uniref:uncharacterized protein LOC143055189 n=1 Tax=Mytilus galloprovincialis TaxID=29158 RepID=UPI003F7B9D81
MSQMSPSAGPGYILPTLTQGQRNFYAPTQVPQMRASPRWPTQQKQHTQANEFQNMPGRQVRPVNPATAGARQPGQSNIRGGMNARPITRQSCTEQPPRMPQSIPTRRQVAFPTAVPNQLNRHLATQMRSPQQIGGQHNMVMPQNYMSEEFHQKEDSSLYDSSSSSPEDEIISTFYDIINKLTLRSDNIDEITDVIIQMLQNCSDDRVISYIIDYLFEKSIIEPDFHYTGAQLVKFLFEKLRTVPTLAYFRSLFITR